MGGREGGREGTRHFFHLPSYKSMRFVSSLLHLTYHHDGQWEKVEHLEGEFSPLMECECVCVYEYVCVCVCVCACVGEGGGGGCV